MDSREPNILERAVHSISEQAANTNKVIDEAGYAGLAADHPATVAAEQLRIELLKVKADPKLGAVSPHETKRHIL